MRRSAALCATVIMAVVAGGVSIAPATAVGAVETAAPAVVQDLDRCKAPPTGADFSEGFALPEGALPSTGPAPARVQTIYVDFDDAPGDDGDIERLESLADAGEQILEEQAGGRFGLERHGAEGGWHWLPGESTRFSDAKSVYREAVESVADAVDFEGIDVVWVVWSTRDDREDMRAQAFNDADVVIDEHALNRGVVMRVSDFISEGSWIIEDSEWIIAHETGHTLGLPDLYDLEDATGTDKWTGGWDMMANVWAAEGRALLGWHRWRLAWLDDEGVTCLSPGALASVTLAPLQSDSGTRLALVRLDETRLLAVESRRATGLDENIKVTGPLVYTIDTTRDSGSGPVMVQFPDGREPEVRNTDTLTEAPLQVGERYTEPTTGVTVELLESTEDEDLVVIDTTALAQVTEPKKSIAYYQTMTLDGQYVTPLDLLRSGTGVEYVNLAAFHLDLDHLLLNGYAPDDPRYDRLWEQLRLMQNVGVKVLGMIGGAKNESWISLSRDFDVQYDRLRQLVLDQGLDGLDLDVETETELSVVTDVIDALRRDFGPEFLITMSPAAPGLMGQSEMSELDYDELYRQRGDDIAWFNLQFYCGWGEPTSAEYLDIVDYQSSRGAGVPPQKLVMAAITTPDRCPEQEGWIGLERLQREIRGTVAVEPDFGGIAGWEYAGSWPGGAAASWQWWELMYAAMTQPAPTPTPTPTDTQTPVPTVSPRGDAALASTGGGAPAPWIWGVAALLLAGGVAGVVTGARRRARR